MNEEQIHEFVAKANLGDMANLIFAAHRVVISFRRLSHDTRYEWKTKPGESYCHDSPDLDSQVDDLANNLSSMLGTEYIEYPDEAYEEEGAT